MHDYAYIDSVAHVVPADKSDVLSHTLGLNTVIPLEIASHLLGDIAYKLVLYILPT